MNITINQEAHSHVVGRWPEMATGLRDIVAVIVAVDSPMGRAVDAVDELTAHLPSAADPLVCPLSPGSPGPATCST